MFLRKMCPSLFTEIRITVSRFDIKLYLLGHKIDVLSVVMFSQVEQPYLHWHIVFHLFVNHNSAAFIVKSFLTCGAVFTYFTYLYLFNTMCIEWRLNHVHQGRYKHIKPSSSLKKKTNWNSSKAYLQMPISTIKGFVFIIVWNPDTVSMFLCIPSLNDTWSKHSIVALVTRWFQETATLELLIAFTIGFSFTWV